MLGVASTLKSLLKGGMSLPTPGGSVSCSWRVSEKGCALAPGPLTKPPLVVDAIVTPTSPTAAFKLGDKVDDPLAMYLADIYTVTANLAGIPGVSIPCGETKEKLPIGLQILGRHFDEATILRVAKAYEQAA